MVTLWELNLIAGGANIVLLLGLLYVYSSNLRQVRTPFGLGLVVFALLFVAQNVVGMLTVMNWWSQGWGPGVAEPMLAINLAETAAFSVLLFISWG